MNQNESGERSEDIGLLLHALADGEVDAATALELERRMASDPALANRYRRIVALGAAVRDLPRPDVDPALRARIAAMADGRRRSGQAPRRPELLFGWRSMAASVLVAALLGGGAAFWLVQPARDARLAEAVADASRRGLLAASPVDVASSDRHTVKPWLDRRIGLSPPAPDLAQSGYVLLGGRVEVVLGRSMPALVYRYREHLITVIADPLAGAGRAPRQPGDISAGGFSIVRWSDGAFSYWAVSDAERAALDRFVARFRQSTGPG